MVWEYATTVDSRALSRQCRQVPRIVAWLRWIPSTNRKSLQTSGSDRAPEGHLRALV